MIENVIISTSALSMIFFGQYLALKGEFGYLSPIENIANLLIFPLITIYWTIVFLFNIFFAMILALLQQALRNSCELLRRRKDCMQTQGTAC